MGVSRYIYGLVPIYETIRNYVEIGMHPERIATEVYNKGYRLEVRMNKIPKTMMHELYLTLAEQCWYTMHKNHNYITEATCQQKNKSCKK